VIVVTPFPMAFAAPAQRRVHEESILSRCAGDLQQRLYRSRVHCRQSGSYPRRTRLGNRLKWRNIAITLIDRASYPLHGSGPETGFAEISSDVLEAGRVEDWRGVPKVQPSLFLPVSSGSASIAKP
jgi:hypothetical protein